MPNQNHPIEIEKKYVLDKKDYALFEALRAALSSEAFLSDYQKGPVKVADQIDIYYDTKERAVYQENMILRLRTSKKNRHRVTIKKDMENAATDTGGPLARFEFEYAVESDDMREHWDLIKTHCGDLSERFEPKDFFPVIRVEKKREKRIFSKEDFCFEMALDSVAYVNLVNGVRKEEFQVEIELKSDPSNSLLLKSVTDALEKTYQNLKSDMDSKYKRAIDLTEGKKAV